MPAGRSRAPPVSKGRTMLKEYEWNGGTWQFDSESAPDGAKEVKAPKDEAKAKAEAEAAEKAAAEAAKAEAEAAAKAEAEAKAKAADNKAKTAANKAKAAETKAE